MAERIFGGGAQLAVLRKPEVSQEHVHWLGWTSRTTYGRALSRLRGLIRQKRFDAIMSFSLMPSVLSRLATAGVRPRPALVAMEITRPFMEQALWAGTWRYPIMWNLRRWAFGGCDLLGANSIDGVEECVRHYGVAAERAFRVHNLLVVNDLTAWAASPPQELEGDSPEGFRICMMTRLDPMKGIDLVMGAVAGLPRELGARLWIVGDGPDRARLQSLAAALQVEDRVRFFGWQANPHAFLKRADLFVLASTFEGYSNSVIEAMAIGTPVLTSYCSSDAREMVSYGAATGFEASDGNALRLALIDLARKPERRAALARAAQDYIRPLHADRAIRGYEQLVERALELRRGR